MTAQPTDAYATWQRAVAKVLAKERDIDPDVAEPERLLEHVTYDGITVAPLYTSADERAEAPQPGQPPFTRGGAAALGDGWDVCVRYGDSADAATVNRRILDDLENGATSIWLALGEALAPEEVRVALEGVLLDLAPIRLDAGARFGAAADAMLDYLDTARVEQPSAVRLRLGADPWTVRIRNGADVAGAGLQDAVALATRVAERSERIHTFTVDGTVFHNAGASDADEIGMTLAAGAGYLRALLDAGLDPAAALAAIEFRYAVSDDQFAGIAKLRAARTGWARIAEVAGAPEAGAALQHAVTSSAMMTRRDPWVNMLRTTLAAFAAGVGGADDVTVLAFDQALGERVPATSERFADRIARNTQLLLLEESNLGKVKDPAGGAWYVEQHTDAVAEAAWRTFQEIERRGGFAAALESGWLTERIVATRTRRGDDIAHRRVSITGVNEFPNADEPLLSSAPSEPSAVLVPHRYDEAYDQLRDRSDRVLAETGTRPQVLLVVLGSIAEHNQPATYARNLLASAGIETVSSEPIDDPAAVTDAVRDSRWDIAVVCGTNARYEHIGADVVSALRASGVGYVYATGDGSFGANGDGPDERLRPDIDVVATMNTLLDRLGVS